MKKKPIEPRQRAELVEAAKTAQSHAYCPYSHYPVGAAILAESGKVYAGCNVESPTLISNICAERAAIFHMLSHGERRIAAVVTVSKASEPCGSCRQLIREFGDEDTPIVSLHVDGGKEKVVETTISKLLPHAHTIEVLEEARGKS
jgi:cytidine deaminase